MTRPIVWLIGGYRVDVLTLIEPGQSATLSGDRLESGANYVDHVEQDSDKLRIEGVVSDFPTGEMIAVRDAEREGSTQGSYRASTYGRARLTELKQQGLPIDVVTPDVTFTSYMITNIVAPLHPHELKFSLQLEQVRLVTLARELVRVPTAAGKKNHGVDPFTKLAKGLAQAGKDWLKDQAGNPIQIYDDQGKMSGWYSPTFKQWYSKDGRAIDPANDQDDLFRAKAGERPKYDAKSQQWLTPEGVPVSKTPAARRDAARKNQVTSAVPANTANGKLLRAINPWWKDEPGAI